MSQFWIGGPGVFSVVLLAVTVSCSKQAAAPPGESAGPKPEEIVRRVADLYKTARSFQVSFSHTFSMEMLGEKSQVVVDSSVVVERPNRMALRAKSSPKGVDLVCDGRTLTVSMTGKNRYLQVKAPESLADLLRDPAFTAFGGGSAPFFLNLLAEDPYETIMERVTSSSYQGQETIDQVRAHHLGFTQQDLDWQLWVAAEGEPVVVQVAVDMSKVFGQLDGQAREMKVTWVQTYKDWQLDAAVARDVFVFTPAPGAAKVETFFELPGAGRDRPIPLSGEPAPDIELKLLDGGDFSLASHRGKHVVMLYLWSSTSGPCAQELPVLAEVARQFRNQGVVFCALNQGEDPETIRRLLEELDLDIPVALDPEGSAGRAYGLQGISTVVLIDKEGTVRAVHVGYQPDIKEILQEELAALLQRQAVRGQRSPGQSALVKRTAKWPGWPSATFSRTRSSRPPIPGMIVPEQVDNLALAVMQRRELDVQEKAELERATDRAWANLPYHYRWLKDWEWV